MPTIRRRLLACAAALTVGAAVAATPAFTAFAADAAAPAPAGQGSAGQESKAFSDLQTREIETIIHQYLVTHPEVLQEAYVALKKREEADAAKQQKDIIASQSDLLFNSKHQVVLGNPKGDVTMVEFFDYNCGYCRRAVADTFKLIDADPKLRVVLKEYPILTQGSVEAAQVAIAIKDVAPDRYADFHRAMFETDGPADRARALAVAEKLGLPMDKIKAAMKGPDVAATLEETRNLADLLQISGTPSYVIADSVLPGAVGYDALKQQVDAVRHCGGTTSSC